MLAHFWSENFKLVEIWQLSKLQIVCVSRAETVVHAQSADDKFRDPAAVT